MAHHRQLADHGPPGARSVSGGITLFYVPDVAALPDPTRALAGVALHIGDGARITRPLLTRGPTLIGHASMAAQLDWCRDHGVARAVFTHRGSEVVRSLHQTVLGRVAALGRERAVARRWWRTMALPSSFRAGVSGRVRASAGRVDC